MIKKDENEITAEIKIDEESGALRTQPDEGILELARAIAHEMARRELSKIGGADALPATGPPGHA